MLALKQKIQARVGVLRNDKFVRNSALFFFGSLLVAFLNYLFYPILGRLMSVEDFGEAQTIVSLLMQFGIITGAFSVLIVHEVANFGPKAASVIIRLRNNFLGLAGMILLAMIFGEKFLGNFFNFSSNRSFLILAIFLPISILVVYESAIVQGLNDYRSVSVVNIIISAGRLLLAAAFVLLSLRAAGVVIGILVANLLGLLYIKQKTRSFFKQHAETSDTELPAGQLRYIWLVFFTTGAINFFSSIDIIVVKHYFSALDAGLYSGIALVAKIIFFVVGSIAAVMFSSLKIEQTAKNMKILKKSLILTFLVGGCVLLTFSIFPDIIVNLLIGRKYLPLAHFLPSLSLVYFLLALINILFLFGLAMRRMFLIAVSALSMIAFLGLVNLRHVSLNELVENFYYIYIFIILLTTFLYAKENHFHNHSDL